MSHPAAAELEQALARAHAASMAGELPAMETALTAALDLMAELTRQGLVPTLERPQSPWHEPTARRLAFEWLAQLKAAGCGAFPYAGTLLGLERDGQLLPHDKDADFAVWLEDFSLAIRVLQSRGLRRATDVPPFDNMACLVDPASGCTVDLFGLRRDPVHGRVEGGVWMYGKPASHQRVLHLPWLRLQARPSPAGDIWWPAPADALLAAFYGDWRTRDADWDTLVSNRALAEVNLQWRCWALKNLCERWLRGDALRTRRLLDQIAARAGGDAQLSGRRGRRTR
jgi:hypothetical protein